jgi:rhodanese-related sulfurtransferase
MKANELLKRIEAKTAPVIIDARSGLEFKSGHIPGAIHAPILKILLKLARLPENKHSELVITCEHGPRAMIAAKVLARYGYGNTTLLEGHMLGWRSADLPLEKELS